MVVVCDVKVPVDPEESEVVVPETVDGFEEEEPAVVELGPRRGTLGVSTVSSVRTTFVFGAIGAT